MADALQQAVANTQAVQGTQEAAPQVGIPTAPEAEKPKVTDSERFAALSRKERLIAQEKRRMQAERASLLKQQQEMEIQFNPWKEASELAKTNKLAALKRLGISYEDLTNDYLTEANGLTPEMVAERRTREITQQQLDEYKKQQQEQQAQELNRQVEQALTQIKSETKDLVESSDEYPVLKQTKQFDAVAEYMRLIYDQEGKILPIEVATRQVEEFLYEQALEIAKIDKIRSKLLEKVEEPKSPGTEIHVPTTTQSKTLTHKTTAAVPSTSGLTSEQRRQRAIDIFHGRIPQ